MISLQTDDTIAAIASAPGGAARGVIRVSGPAALECLSSCFEPGQSLALLHRATTLEGAIQLGGSLGALPCRAMIWPNQQSYTRQKAIEIHTLGSPPLLEATLETLRKNGARLAQPGEFTMRAFLAGRIDLTQAEAVLGVIDAESSEELGVALSQLAGGLAGPLHSLRDDLLNLLAHLEAGLDFVEDDIEFIAAAELDRQLAQIESQIAAIAQQMRERIAVDTEFRIAIVGWPNVGKSSLLNALGGREAAIVSPTPGATRDYVSVSVKLDGDLRCKFIDTAGAEPNTQDGVSAAAQRQAQEQSADAHLTLLCLDVTRPLNTWEQAELDTAQARRLVVLTKADAASPSVSPEIPGAITTSSVSGAGLNQLKTALVDRIAAQRTDESAVVAGTASRCRESLSLATESIARAREATTAGWGEELTAAEIRVALDCLGRVVGAVYNEDVLDRIFSRFCIGK